MTPTKPTLQYPARTPDDGPIFWWRWYGKGQWCRSVDYPELERLSDGNRHRYRVNGLPMPDKESALAAVHSPTGHGDAATGATAKASRESAMACVREWLGKVGR